MISSVPVSILQTDGDWVIVGVSGGSEEAIKGVGTGKVKAKTSLEVYSVVLELEALWELTSWVYTEEWGKHLDIWGAVVLT